MLGQAGPRPEDAGRPGPLLGHLHLGLRHRLLHPQVQIVPAGATGSGAPTNILYSLSPIHASVLTPPIYMHPPIDPPIYTHLYTDRHTRIILTPLHTRIYILTPPYTHIPIQTLPYTHASVYRHPHTEAPRALRSRVCPSARPPRGQDLSWKPLPRQSRERPGPSPQAHPFFPWAVLPGGPAGGDECISH